MKFIKLYIDFEDGNGFVEVESPMNGAFGVKQSEVSKLIFDKSIDIEVSMIGNDFDKILTAKSTRSLLSFQVYSYNYLTKSYDLFTDGEVYLGIDINFNKKIIKLKDFQINNANELPKNFTEKISTKIDNSKIISSDLFDVILNDNSLTFQNTTIRLDNFVNKFFKPPFLFIKWNFDTDPAYTFNSNQLFITYNGFYFSPATNGVIKISLEDLFNDLSKIFNKGFFINNNGEYEFERLSKILTSNTELFNLSDLDYSIDFNNFNSNEEKKIGRINLSFGEKVFLTDTAFMDIDNKTLENKDLSTENIGTALEFMVFNEHTSQNKYSLILAEQSEITDDPINFNEVLTLNRQDVPQGAIFPTSKYNKWLHEYYILKNYYIDLQVYNRATIWYYDWVITNPSVSYEATPEKFGTYLTLNPNFKRLDVINTFKVPYFDLNEKTGYKFRDKFITTPNGKGYIIEAKADINSGIVTIMLEYYDDKKVELLNENGIEILTEVSESIIV